MSSARVFVFARRLGRESLERLVDGIARRNAEKIPVRPDRARVALAGPGQKVEFQIGSVPYVRSMYTYFGQMEVRSTASAPWLSQSRRLRLRAEI